MVGGRSKEKNRWYRRMGSGWKEKKMEEVRRQGKGRKGTEGKGK